jgi:hypothetical protein
MKTSQRMLFMLFINGLSTLPIYAQHDSDTMSNSRLIITPYGRLQLLGFGQTLTDNVQSGQRAYLYLKEARFGIHGNDDGTKLDLQFAFGGEDIIVAPSPGISLQLLDFSIDIPLSESLRLKAGQFKVPYGREGMTNTGYFSFGDRSIQYNAFMLGWDVGLAIYGKSDDFTAALGLFTGGGRDIPIKYLPEKLGIPMIVLRAGYNDGYDEDILDVKQSVYQPSPGSAIYLNALYTADSRIGHSTVLNVKASDKSLLLDANWNPYIATAPLNTGQFWQIGADAGIRTSLKEGILGFAEAELNLGGFDNKYGALTASGGRILFGVYQKPFELAIRYAFINPTSKFAYTSSTHQTYKIVDTKLIHEVTLAATYFIKEDRLKLIADMPILIQAPVINDPVSGAYVLTQQPDQVNYLASGGKVNRQNVIQGRIQLQYAFE